jgi:hypothetical protein
VRHLKRILDAPKVPILKVVFLGGPPFIFFGQLSAFADRDDLVPKVKPCRQEMKELEQQLAERLLVSCIAPKPLD